MIEACVAELVLKGELSEAQAALYRETYKELLKSLKGSMSAAAAAAKATDDTMQAMQARILQRKRLAGLAYRNRKELVGAIRAATERGVPLRKAIQGLYSHDERMPGVSTLEGRYESIRGEAQSMLAPLIIHFERTVTGDVANGKDLVELVHALFGKKDVTPEVADFAQRWETGSEWLRKRFNAAGGNIRKLAGWGLPQMHDAQRIFAAGFEKWRAKTVPRLALQRMLDRETGLPLTGKKLNRLLKEAYEGITSGGWDDRTLTARQGQALANGRQESPPHPLPWRTGR